MASTNGEPLDSSKKTAAEIASGSGAQCAQDARNPDLPLCAMWALIARLNDVALRDAIANGYIVGPRMFVAGAYITITGGAGAMTGLAPDISCPGTCITAKPTARGKCGRRFASSPTMAWTTSRFFPLARC